MNNLRRILVTGGAGFIGSNLVRHLLEAGRSVINVDKLTYAGNSISLRDFNDDANYEFEQSDIVDLQAVRELFKKHRPDAVIHLAAESHVDRSIDAPAAFVQTNLVGTFNMLQVTLEYVRELGNSAANDFRFLQVSTDEVYGTLGNEGSFDEASKYDPRSPYAASKAGADHMVRAWFHTYGLPVLVTNCSNNFGPFQYPEKLIPVVILKSLNEDPIPIFGKGESVRDWLFVDDHCRALLAALDKGRPGETYCIGGGNEYRNIEMAGRVTEILDELKPRENGLSYDQLVTFVEDRPGHDFRYAIDDSKLRRELGWAPQRDFESSLRETVQWYLDNQDWTNAVLVKSNLDRRGLGLSPQ